MHTSECSLQCQGYGTLYLLCKLAHVLVNGLKKYLKEEYFFLSYHARVGHLSSALVVVYAVNK